MDYKGFIGAMLMAVFVTYIFASNYYQPQIDELNESVSSLKLDLHSTEGLVADAEDKLKTASASECY